MDIYRTSARCTITCSTSHRESSWRSFDGNSIRNPMINQWFVPQAMTNFHLLFYLYGLDCFGTRMKTQMTPLLEAVKTQDMKMGEQFMRGDTWSTLEHLIGAHSGQEWVELKMTNSWRDNPTFSSSPGSEIISRRQLEREADGRALIALTSTVARLTLARCAACLVNKFLSNLRFKVAVLLKCQINEFSPLKWTTALVNFVIERTFTLP